MEIFRVRVGNKELGLPESFEMFFQTQEVAERLMATFNSTLKEGNKIDWICDVVHVMDEKDILNQFNEFKEAAEKEHQTKNN